MKRLISIILVAVLIAACMTTAFAKSTKFSDVPESAWYYDEVTSLASAGIINGYSDGTFRPDGTVTNGEAMKLVLLAAGFGEQPKTDSHWASGYLDLAYLYGIVDRPDIDLNKPITRIEVAWLVANSLGLVSATSESPFSDTEANAAIVLYETGIITGSKTDDERLVFNTDAFLKRSEISAIIYRIRNTNFDVHSEENEIDSLKLDSSMTHVLVSCSGYLNIRSEPSTESEIIGRVNAGKTAELCGALSGWYEISYHGVNGYVSADYCTPVDYEVEETVIDSAVRNQVVALAKTYTGVPYVYGGASPSGFDCSGFVLYVMKEFGYNLDHSARAQYSSGTPISKAELSPGDLVFFSNSSTAWIGHVGIYIGDGLFIHASSGSAHCVTISELSSSWYVNHYIDACRIIVD